MKTKQHYNHICQTLKSFYGYSAKVKTDHLTKESVIYLDGKKHNQSEVKELAFVFSGYQFGISN